MVRLSYIVEGPECPCVPWLVSQYANFGLAQIIEGDMTAEFN